MRARLWESTHTEDWTRALDAYPDVIADQQVAQLIPLDHWVRAELPQTVAARGAPYFSSEELVRLTEWKMHRGVWRAPNLVRVKSNTAALVEETTRAACALAPHPTKPIARIATLDGVGPATASALMAIVHPAIYPFFDELVAAQVPSLGAVAWTLGYYAKYAEQLRLRAAALGESWTAVMVERAVWASLGGKTGALT
jgi:hypothetical protein